jgi:RNA polymerase sigma factor (sigma-70 family)
MTVVGPTFEDVRRALSGSQGGYEALDRRFRPRLEVWVARLRADPSRFGVRWKRHIQTDDVVQEALRRAYAGLQGLTDPTTGSFWTWLKHVAHNALIDLMRRQGGHAHDVEASADDGAGEPAQRVPAREPKPLAHLLALDLRERLGRALATLDPRDAQVLELCYLSGRTLAEIGELLGVRTTRVHQLKARALLRLRDTLGGGKGSLAGLLGGST